MQKLTDATDSFRLVLELRSGTVMVRGSRVELPPREFRLLAKLADKPGEPIRPQELVASVWPDVPDTPLQDLYPVMRRLRDFLGDREAEEKLIRNRRRYGYYLDLEPSEVLVTETLPSEPIVIRLEPEESDDEPAAGDAVVAATQEIHASPRAARTPWGRSVVAAAGVLVLLVSAWSAGFVLSRQRSQPDRSIAAPEQVAEDTSDGDGTTKESESLKQRPRKERKQGGSGNKGRKKRSGKRGAPLIAQGPSAPAPVPGPAAPPPATSSAPQRQRSDGGGGGNAPNQQQPQSKPQPSYPPPPTLPLLHLYDSNSGDHVMTTNSSVASQKEAAGYTRTTVGKVYGASGDGRVPISLDAGTAYIFRDSSPKTDPGCAVAGLYRMTKNGDSFYTSSSSSASQWEASGWSKAFVGYIGAC